jgi:FO synthase
VHMEAPMYLKGRARRGPTFREALLMHAVARLVLHGLIDNVQASWVKMGVQGVAACLGAGVNDLGGTLMNESITRAAGSDHGQEWAPAFMEQQIVAAGRRPRMRTTLYGDVSPARRRAAFMARPLAPMENASAGKRQRSKRLIPVEAVRLELGVPAHAFAARSVGHGDGNHLVYEQVMLMAACN